VWHRAGSAPARRVAARREPARERVGAHAWVRLPAAPAGASADLPGAGRAQDPPSGAVPPDGRPTVVGERGARPPDRRVPRTPAT
jgi:hypothetical protein